MALAERTPSCVLPGEPDVGPLEHDRTERDRLTERPVDLVVGNHLGPLLELPRKLRVQVEPVWNAVALAASSMTTSRSIPVSAIGWTPSL